MKHCIPFQPDTRDWQQKKKHFLCKELRYRRNTCIGRLHSVIRIRIVNKFPSSNLHLTFPLPSSYLHLTFVFSSSFVFSSPSCRLPFILPSSYSTVPMYILTLSSFRLFFVFSSSFLHLTYCNVPYILTLSSYHLPFFLSSSFHYLLFSFPSSPILSFPLIFMYLYPPFLSLCFLLKLPFLNTPFVSFYLPFNHLSLSLFLPLRPAFPLYISFSFFHLNSIFFYLPSS